MKRATENPLHNIKADHCGGDTGSHLKSWALSDIGTKENEEIKKKVPQDSQWIKTKEALAR